MHYILSNWNRFMRNKLTIFTRKEQLSPWNCVHHDQQSEKFEFNKHSEPEPIAFQISKFKK